MLTACSDSPVSRSTTPTTSLKPGRNQKPPLSPTPALITSDDKEPQYFNTSGSSDEDSESDHFSKPTKPPSKGDIIRTSDLPTSSRVSHARSPGSIPTSKSQTSYGDGARQSIAHKAKENSDFSSSSSRTVPIPIPSANPRVSNEHLGTSPRPDLSLIHISEPTRPY